MSVTFIQTIIFYISSTYSHNKK